MTRYESYKPSHIPWLKDIPSHWERKTLSQLTAEHKISNKGVNHQNLLSLSYGRIVRKDINKTDGLLPASFESYQIIEPGNIVLRLTDLQNDHKSLRVGLCKEEGIVTSAYVAIEPKRQYYPEFLYLLLHTYDILKVFYSMGGGIRQGLNYQGLCKIGVLLPPLGEQKKIVEFLSTKTSLIDALLSKKQSVISLQRELLENLVFFGGDNGKATIHGWGNDFPSNWKLVKGRRLFEEIDLKGFSDECFVAVTQDKALIFKDEGDVNFVTAADPRTQKLVCPNQFVISLRSFQGGLELSNIRGLISPAYSVFRLKESIDNEKTRAFFRFLFKSRPYISLLNSLSDSLRDGKSIKYAEVADFEYPLPPSDFLEYFYKEVEKFDILQQEYIELEKLLTEYKQRLIADVVTGQVNVQNL